MTKRSLTDEQVMLELEIKMKSQDCIHFHKDLIWEALSRWRVLKEEVEIFRSREPKKPLNLKTKK